jgi:hypothetical protein
MKKSDINQPPCYFDRYMRRVDDIEIGDALRGSQTELENLDLEGLRQLGDVAYSEGKWTVKDIFQHLIDAEHVLSYRALRIGRNDETVLPGFDQDLFAANVSTKGGSIEKIVNQLKMIRKTTESLFETFDKAAMLRSSAISGNQMSVLAYGFAIVGHQRHHFEIIDTRYLPLITELNGRDAPR